MGFLKRAQGGCVAGARLWRAAGYAHRATGAVVVTSGEFTHAARAAATREPRVQLIDGAALRRMLGTDSVGLALHSEDAAAAAPAAPPIPAWHGVASPARRGRRPRRSRNPLPEVP
ncbi:restriction endonuclease [Dyella sp. KRB-257]|uniref:restriction endonuclease n=1 Tax=Dyella sp. KRB-257 TaxID=3400915 RepID=UPI003BFB547C